MKKKRQKDSRSNKYANNPLVQAFAMRLKAWRQEKRITLKTMAAGMGVSMAVICEWEHGHRFPSADHLLAISEYTGILAAELIRPVKVAGLKKKQRARGC